MQKEKKLPRFFESLFPRWFNDFPEEIELNSSPPCVENTGIDERGGAVINSINKTAQPDIVNEPESAKQEDSESNSRPMQAGEQRKVRGIHVVLCIKYNNFSWLAIAGMVSE